MVMLLETVSTIQITFEEIYKSKGQYFCLLYTLLYSEADNRNRYLAVAFDGGKSWYYKSHR